GGAELPEPRGGLEAHLGVARIERVVEMRDPPFPSEAREVEEPDEPERVPEEAHALVVARPAHLGKGAEGALAAHLAASSGLQSARSAPQAAPRATDGLGWSASRAAARTDAGTTNRMASGRRRT